MSARANAVVAGLASDRAIYRAFHWLHLHELRFRQWQFEMIAIPAPPFAEAARALWFLERFTELGLTTPHLDPAGNALALLPSGPLPVTEAQDPPPAVLLSAHLDTVFPPGTVCRPVEDGAKILAPGACDNAAGLTALLAIAAALKAAGITPPCPILFAANVGEEGEGDLRGMRQLFANPPTTNPQSADPQPSNPQPAQPRVAAALALEGSGNATVVDRALGSRRFRIRLTGPGGHSWADAARPNPIFVLAEALAALSRLPLPASPRTTLQVGTIAGGTSVNSIPASAAADIDIRSVSSDVLALTEAAALETIRSTVQDAQQRFSGQPPLTLDIRLTGDRPAAALPADSPLLRCLQAVDRHLDIATEPRIGSTDANLPLSLGVPALAIGAGGTGGGIHTLQEWYDPSGRELALRRILLLLLAACEQISSGSSPI